VTVRDLISEALEELGVVQQGDTLSDNDADLGLRRYNRLLDGWNAQRQAVYADVFSTFTLTPALAPHTIGPTGTFVVTQRPVSIPDGGAGLVLNSSTPNVRTPIVVRDAAWWASQPVKSLTSSYPTDLYYEPAWPNGSLYFWPVPTTAYQVELWLRTVLAQVDLDTVFTMPPGYYRAHVLTLAEECGSAFGTMPSGKTVADAAKARDVMFSNNRVIPRIRTADAGMMPSRGAGRWDWRTGRIG
jgi:hypothetical protein